MDEFVDRMTTQRHVLNLVNKQLSGTEKLFGLSSDAINRWVMANGYEPSQEVVPLLKKISSELFFIATKSQEPVSEEYELRRDKIVELVSTLEKSLH